MKSESNADLLRALELLEQAGAKFSRSGFELVNRQMWQSFQEEESCQL